MDCVYETLAYGLCKWVSCDVKIHRDKRSNNYMSYHWLWNDLLEVVWEKL